MADLKTEADVAAFIAAQPALMAALALVARQKLPDCWIGAGFVRNAVWDALHGRARAQHVGDVDVVYFDPEDPSAETEAVVEASLRMADPSLNWSVKNQARMHLRNAEAPYASVADAMLRWPEICTAIGARVWERGVEIAAPFGVEDLVTLRVRPTPAFAAKLALYRERVRAKRWRERWPLLSIDGA